MFGCFAKVPETSRRFSGAVFENYLKEITMNFETYDPNASVQELLAAKTYSAYGTHRAIMAVERFSEDCPLDWEYAEVAHAWRGKELALWPSFCYLPYDMSHMFFEQVYEVASDHMVAFGDMHAKYSSFAAWRMTKGIYELHPGVGALLHREDANNKLGDDFPVLPEWCIYLSTPHRSWFNSKLYGVWVQFQWTQHAKERELHFLFDTEIGQIPMILPIGDWTVEEALARITTRENLGDHPIGDVELQNFIKSAAQQLRPIVEMVRFLCRNKGDISNKNGKPGSPVSAQQNRAKPGSKLYAKDEPTFWMVGTRKAAML